MVMDDWDDFIARKPDGRRYFCVACLAVWEAKPKSRGYNRCRQCGCIYGAADLIHLPADKRLVKVILAGQRVDVPRERLDIPAFKARLADPVNRALLSAQYVP